MSTENHSTDRWTSQLTKMLLNNNDLSCFTLEEKKELLDLTHKQLIACTDDNERENLKNLYVVVKESVGGSVAADTVVCNLEDDTFLVKDEIGNWSGMPLSKQGFAHYASKTFGITNPKGLANVISEIPHVRQKLPVFTKPNERVVTVEGLSTFNTYEPSTLQAKPGNFEIYEELLLNLAGDAGVGGYCHLLQWVASAYQSIIQGKGPKLMGTAIVLHGAEGAGKGLLYRILSGLYGAKNTIEIGQGSVDGKFNEEIAHKLIVCLNEVMDNPKTGKEAINKIKPWITDERITIEGKGKKTKDYVNTMNIVVSSNEAAPVIIAPEERRFTVFKSSVLDKNLGLRIHNDLIGDRKQLSAFAMFLQNLNITIKFGDIYRTEAKNDIQIEFMASEVEFINEIKEDGWIAVSLPWAEAGDKEKPRMSYIKDTDVAAYTMYEVYRHWYKTNGKRNSLASVILFSKQISKLLMDGAKTVNCYYAGTQIKCWKGVPSHAPDFVRHLTIVPESAKAL